MKAISEKAKISGLLVQKVELGPAGAFEEAKTIEDFADILLDGPGGPVEQFRPVTDEDREGLTDLLEHHGREVQEFLAAISARPIIGARRIENPADIRAAEAKRLRDQRRLGNPAAPTPHQLALITCG